MSDAPRFGYRGMELDVARHFVTVDSVKRFIDLLALHNINRFTGTSPTIRAGALKLSATLASPRWGVSALKP